MRTPSDQPSTLDTIRYQVDRFLSWSPFSRFVGLFGLSFFLIALCAVLAKLLIPTPEGEESKDLLEWMWWAMTRVADAGTMGDDEGTLKRIIATMATLSGVGVVALLIGLVSSTIGDKIEDLRKGKSPVIDAGHTLLLGFGEKAFAVLRELREANKNLKAASVVILSETDKEEVENAVKERLGDMLSTRVVVRQGSPSSVHDLRKVGAGRARSIIVLGADHRGDEGDADDMGAIKILLALRRIPGALRKNHAVVELTDGSRRSVVEQLGAGGVEVVSMTETLSRMLVQTARQNGLAQVYRELLTYEGSEFYFTKVGALAGLQFGQAQWRVNNAVVCGVRHAGHTELNPRADLVLQAEDELLVIAEDDDSFSLNANHEVRIPDDFRGAKAVARTPERLLLCGTSPSMGDMLLEFDNYVQSGSEAWLMPGVDKTKFVETFQEPLGKLKNLKPKFVDGDPTMPDDLKRVVSPDFAVAAVVADTTRPPDEADAHTVITVLLLRDLFRQYGDAKPRIISEILDPRTKDLLEQEYGADFVVSSEMTSMLLAQVSERRELNAVFADLFDADGNEVYLKRAACFATPGHTVTWLQVQKVAQQRGEVAIGYVKRDVKPAINPKQLEALVFTEEDRVIVIAQDDKEEVVPVSIPTPAPQPAVRAPRSGLLPPDAPAGKIPEKTVTSGPRVAGPSTQPRPPLPPVKKP
jgi:ion channel POLLUX/CASTOR